MIIRQMYVFGVSSASISNMVKIEEMEHLLREAQAEKNRLLEHRVTRHHSLTILSHSEAIPSVISLSSSTFLLHNVMYLTYCMYSTYWHPSWKWITHALCDILILNVWKFVCLVGCFPPLASQFDPYPLHPSHPESMTNVVPFSVWFLFKWFYFNIIFCQTL